MALKATVFKAALQIADMDRHFYQDFNLTLARHPSETDERMMLRLLAFARHASEALQFTKGLSTDDEPDLWEKDLSGDIALWIDLGLPDESRVRKACARSRQVWLYTYGGRAASLWWQKNGSRLARFDNLHVVNIPAEVSSALAALAERTMQLQCNIQDGQLWIGDGTQTVTVEPESLYP
ncbi:YaeQ family protein [Mangrovitalea sediminis]|uniref:YaeQ family protein n=1 Tax=Mangrovitalea sediminis TaxID=1982043 RepID=UPI000BE5D330|nr:YaeQ family protein [Mangrovitalea sediminis]